MDGIKDIWEAAFGPEKGNLVRSALLMLVLSGLTTDDICRTIGEIERTTAIGPLVDPTAYLDGTRFKNADEYVKVLRALHTLIEGLPTRDNLFADRAGASGGPRC